MRYFSLGILLGLLGCGLIGCGGGGIQEGAPPEATGYVAPVDDMVEDPDDVAAP